MADQVKLSPEELTEAGKQVRRATERFLMALPPTPILRVLQLEAEKEATLMPLLDLTAWLHGGRERCENAARWIKAVLDFCTIVSVENPDQAGTGEQKKGGEG